MVGEVQHFQGGGAYQAALDRSYNHDLPQRLGTCLSTRRGHVLLPSAIRQVVMVASVKAGREAVYKAPGGGLSCGTTGLCRAEQSLHPGS